VTGFARECLATPAATETNSFAVRGRNPAEADQTINGQVVLDRQDALGQYREVIVDFETLIIAHANAEAGFNGQVRVQLGTNVGTDSRGRYAVKVNGREARPGVQIFLGAGDHVVNGGRL